MKVVVLDTSPLWLLTFTPPGPGDPCRRWVSDLLSAGHRVVVPEITDYETRRELLRRGEAARVNELDLWTARFTGPCEYLPITRPVMRRAAELWALARQAGQPTAGDNTIDADMILVALAESLNEPGTVIATTNVGHLSRFFSAELWSNITP